MGARPEVGMSFVRAAGSGPIETEVRARMEVHIGIDPHKASVAVAVLDEAVGELVERATFPHNRAGLRALERSKRNGSPSVALGGGECRRPRPVPGGEAVSGWRISGGRAA